MRLPQESTHPPVETRGIVVYLDMETTRQEILDRVERYITTGFNFLVLKVFCGGRTIFPSETMAEIVGGPTRRRHDPVAMLLETARMHGLPVFAGFEVLEHVHRKGSYNPLFDQCPSWFISDAWPPAAALRERTARRGAKENRPESIHWLSPMHRDARRFLGSLLVEASMRYPFDGIYLDHLSMPAVADEAFLSDRRTSDLFRQAVPPLEEDEEVPEMPTTLEGWHEWMKQQLLAFTNYLRQRLYKARPQIVMGLEMHAPEPPPEETGERRTLGEGERVPCWRLEMDWQEALDQVVDLLLPRYDIEGDHPLGHLEHDLRAMGRETPLLPVLNLHVSELHPRPFDEIRHSSVLGLVIDAGRPLHERQWLFLQDLFAGPAIEAHSDPEAAVRAVLEHTAALLPEDSDVLALLRDLLRVLSEAEDERAMEKTRDSVVTNIKGLLDMARDAKLELPPEPARWQIVRNLGLLVRLQSMIQSRGQMLRSTPYYAG